MADSPEPVDALSALGDATRRSAYDFVCAQGRPVGRDEVAGGLGIGRTLAAYHLDRLATAGLLSVAYARRSGRSGPGAGRPAKLYERSDREVAVSVPPRDYGVAARLLADAAAQDEEGTTRLALRDAAESLGREIAASAGDSPDLHGLLRGLIGDDRSGRCFTCRRRVVRRGWRLARAVSLALLLVTLEETPHTHACSPCGTGGAATARQAPADRSWMRRILTA